MGTKLYIKTFGCQMNEYDSQKTADILKNERNVIVTDNPDDADIILLNTCSIREKAEEKVYSDLGRLRKLKDKNPKLKIGVGGCVATQEGWRKEGRGDDHARRQKVRERRREGVRDEWRMDRREERGAGSEEGRSV